MKRATASRQIKCSKCSKTVYIKTTQSGKGTMPKGWVSRVSGLFHKTFCPKCA